MPIIPGSDADRFTVYAFIDNGVTEPERDMIARALARTVPVFGCPFFFHRSSRWTLRPWTTAEELIAAAGENEKGQADGRRILEALFGGFREWGRKGALLLFTSRDLAMGDTWCFALTGIRRAVSVLSLYRYRALPADQRETVIARTLRHELGHIFRCAADPRRAETQQRFGPHCTHPGCSMRQTATLAALLRAAGEEDPEDFFCPLCRQDMARFRASSP